MIKSSNSLLFFIIVVFSSCSSLPEVSSAKLDRDTSSPKFYLDSESRMLYAVSNDDQNIYITLKTSEFSSQMRILNSGINIWIDNELKTKTGKGFKYPVQDVEAPKFTGRQMMTGAMRGRDNEMMDKRRVEAYQKYQSRISYIQLYGFLEEDSKEKLNYGVEKCPVKVALELDTLGDLTYSAIVPLKEIFDANDITSSKFNLGVEIESPSFNEDRPSGMSSGMNPPMGGGGRMPGGGNAMGSPMGGGGRPSGGRPGMSSGIMNMPVEVNFWFTVNLEQL